MRLLRNHRSGLFVIVPLAREFVGDPDMQDRTIVNILSCIGSYRPLFLNALAASRSLGQFVHSKLGIIRQSLATSRSGPSQVAANCVWNCLAMQTHLRVPASESDRSSTILPML